MSFRFNWPEFDDHFIEKASKELENALNQWKETEQHLRLDPSEGTEHGNVPS